VGAYLHQVYRADAPALYAVLPRKVVTIALGMDVHAKYRIMKYTYGLTDAEWACYYVDSDHMIAKGYSRTASYLCLFVKFNSPNRAYVLCHLDDV
jgi:hypothetical protein